MTLYADVRDDRHLEAEAVGHLVALVDLAERDRDAGAERELEARPRGRGLALC